MTPEQLDEIEKLAEAWNVHRHFIDAPPLAKQVLPLVKAVRECRAEVEELREELEFIKSEYGNGDPAEMTADALMLKVNAQSAALTDLEQERSRLESEVERLREAVRQVHALAEKSRADWPRHTAWGALVDIHTITKGMVE